MISLQRYREYISFRNILYLLLFLYPLFATVVRHWNSTIFILIMLLGLVYFFAQRKKDNIVLHKYEKIFLWLLAGNFFVFLLTSLMNLPEDIRELRFDIEARFLLIIPLYFLLLIEEDGFKWLAYGAVISIFIAFGFYIYTIHIDGQPEFSGIYSRLYTGPVVLIYAALSVIYLLYSLKIKKVYHWVILLLVITFAGISIMFTHAKAALVGLWVVTMLIATIYPVKRWKIIFVSLVIAVTLFVALGVVEVRHRLADVYRETVEYISISNSDARLKTNLNGSSVGTRLEMWRAVPRVFHDHPIFGVGNGNYNKIMKIYIEKNYLNPIVDHHSHAHNVFVNAFILKGLLGFLMTAMVLFYPLYVYIKTYKSSRASALIGISFVVIIFIVSMNETAPFVKSNFVATYLLLNLVLFHHHMKHIREKLNG